MSTTYDIKDFLALGDTDKVYIGSNGMRYEVSGGRLYNKDKGRFSDISLDTLYLTFKEPLADLKDKWSRADKGEYYSYINSKEIDGYVEDRDATDDDFYDIANYFSDGDYATTVMNNQTLQRLVWRFRDTEDIYVDWLNTRDLKGYYIVINSDSGTIECDYMYSSRGINSIYFTNRELAMRCIEEIVAPFLEKVSWII